MSKFIPSYHHHFAKQCRVSDYGYSKLLELLEAVPHVLQVLRLIIWIYCTFVCLYSTYCVFLIFILFTYRSWVWVPSVYWPWLIVLKWNASPRTCSNCSNFKPANKWQSGTSCRHIIGQSTLLVFVFKLPLLLLEVLILFRLMLAVCLWVCVWIHLINSWRKVLNIF